MNLLFVFCALHGGRSTYRSTCSSSPSSSDEEVWLGFVLHGWWAKATANPCTG